MKQTTLILTIMITFGGCLSQQRLSEGMYEGIKTKERMENPKYNEERIQQHKEPMKYHEYQERIQESEF